MTSFTVNRAPVRYRLAPDTPLLFALRDASNLTGTKYGCDTGECGSCTVWVDGSAVKSCRVSIGEIEGTFVTTIEGLSDGRDHVLQQAFIEKQVPQCGYCQSGIIMAAAALLKANPNPSVDDVKAAIGNLCRCGAYGRVTEAVLHAAEIQRGG